MPNVGVAMYEEIDDLKIRLIFIPFFGIIIPNLTGLIDNSQYSIPGLIASYIYFIFIAFAIWHGNRYLLLYLRPQFSWLNQPMMKVFALLFSNVFYTVPISVGLLTLWYQIGRNSKADWDAVFEATLLCVICVIFITHVYETVFVIQQWESNKVKGETLEKAKAQAELEALKNQVAPHFIFNSLNTLSYLIDANPGNAKIFNDNLADVYRYILMNKERDLVLLKEELEFTEKYFSLLKIRFGDAIQYSVTSNGTQVEEYLIPPISLQVLVENALKHNEASIGRSLTISCTIKDGTATISNKIIKKATPHTSAKVGLHNLNERYKLITDKEITVKDEEGIFSVSLPLLKVS